MAINYSNDYKIYVNKDIPTGDSPFSPKNPSHSMTKNPEPSAKSALNLGIGMAYARRAGGTLAQEIKRDGDEMTAMAIQNTMNGIGRATTLAIAPKVAIAAMFVEGVTSMVSSTRERERENIKIEQANKLRGNIVNIAKGGGVYD